MSVPSWRFEDAARREGKLLVAGVDEAGRGCLAGPVVAAAVILDRRARAKGINDSKLLTPAQREAAVQGIFSDALAVSLGMAAAEEVDGVNILKATLAAMLRAVDALPLRADHLLVDALTIPATDISQVAVIHGDQRCYSIAAASIVAKVIRDRVMEHYSQTYPAFDFASNKGYGTPLHLEALAKNGPCPIHRRTFRGVWAEGQLPFPT